jgi:hypothetical protein
MNLLVKPGDPPGLYAALALPTSLAPAAAPKKLPPICLFRRKKTKGEVAFLSSYEYQ